MLTLGPSAAAAQELGVSIVQLGASDPAYDPFDPIAFYQRTESAQVVLASGSTVTQWAKIHLGGNGTRPNVSVRCSRPDDGSPSNTCGISIYTSNSDTEDGSTLSYVGGGYPEQLTYSNGNGSTGTAQLALYGSPKWLYISCSSDGAASEVGAFVTTLAFLGQRAAGRSFMGIRHPDRVRGSTRVSQFFEASDSIRTCPDISSHGSRLTGSNARWGAAMTHEAGEPTYTESTYSLAYSSTDWHKIYVPAGRYIFTDLPGGAEAYYGSIMAIYSGPSDADYADLTFVAGNSIAFSGGSYEMATLTVSVATATWLYIQHAYTFNYDGNTPAVYPEIVTSWAPLATQDAFPEPIVGRTRVLSIRWAPNPIEGFTTVRARGLVTLPPDVGRPDQIYGSTSVMVKSPNYVDADPDLIAGLSAVGIAYTPDLSGNPPITIGVTLTGGLQGLPLEIPSSSVGPGGVPARTREIAVLKVTPYIPVVVHGIPTTPAHVAQKVAASTLNQGGAGIRSLSLASILRASTAKKMSGHWLVDSLASPANGPYDLLSWPPAADTPTAPKWLSAAPFAPTVAPLALDSAASLFATAHEVDYDRAVLLSPQGVEHMWLDFGGPRRQPFTWVIACVVTNFPRGYEHYVLDAGRDPAVGGFPSGKTVADLGTDYPLTEGLAYRSLLSYSDTQELLSSSVDKAGVGAARLPTQGNIVPRMLFGVYNGADSLVGDYSAYGLRSATGRIPSTSAQEHRYYVLGRAQGIISQGSAASLAIFEVRFWNAALSALELAAQYAELSSTYRFNQVGRP